MYEGYKAEINEMFLGGLRRKLSKGNKCNIVGIFAKIHAVMLIVDGDATDGANKDTTDAVDGGGDSDAKIEQVTTQKLGTQVSVYQPPPPNMLVGVGEKDLPQLEGVYIQFKVSRF